MMKIQSLMMKLLLIEFALPQVVVSDETFARAIVLSGMLLTFARGTKKTSN